MIGSISIVLVNWNSGSLLRDCVNSIACFCHDMVHELIIVDNASADDSLNGLEFQGQLTIIRNKTNKGFAAACNQGYAMAKAPYLLLLNPDTRLYSDTLPNCVAFMNANPQASVVGGKHFDEKDTVQPSCSRFPTVMDFVSLSLGLHQLAPSFFRSPVLMTELDYNKAMEVDQVMGAFMFIKRSVIEDQPFFMDDRFYVYMEDLDFSKRIKLSGGRSYYEPGIKVYHKGNGTTDQVKALRLVFSVQSRMKYVKKYFSTPGYLLVGFCSFAIEPFSRLLYVVLKGKKEEAREVIKAYRLLFSNYRQAS